MWGIEGRASPILQSKILTPTISAHEFYKEDFSDKRAIE